MPAQPKPRMSSTLQIQALSKRYGEVVVADAVELTLQHGECLGVIGPNGAGKSSLFHLITGTVQPDRGSVKVEGQELVGLAPFQRVKRGVARAFQVPQPFLHLSVYENVLVGAEFGAGLRGAEAAEWAWAQVQRVGLAGRAELLAGGLPLLDRKRLELAKALSAKPKLLLLDEIAGGLTEAEVHELVNLVAEIKPGVATIWIEHIAHALKAVSDRIMVLHFGRKLLEGPPVEVMDSAVVREIYMGIASD